MIFSKPSRRTRAALLNRAARRPAPLAESLEPRLLLSTSATAQLNLVSVTGTAQAPLYNYDITVTNTGTTKIGGFWFSWVPGADFLPSIPTVPSSTNDPTGWSPTITGSHTSGDGSAIEWVASTSAAIATGHALSGFDFSSPDSPTVLEGSSPTHPGSSILTAFVYAGVPLANPTTDPGVQIAPTIAPLSASKLVITQQPPTTIPANQNFSTIVHIEDAAGETITTDNSLVTLSLVTPNGATLSGTLTAQAVDGVATFPGLSMTQAGNFTIKAIDGNLTTAASNPFTITPLAATQLVLTHEPASGTPNNPLSPLSVAIEDQFNNIVTSDVSTVTLAIHTSPDGATLSGNTTATATAVNGIATFTTASVDQTGNYTLTATDGNFTAASTDSFDVEFIPTHLVISAPALSTSAGQTLSTVTVTVEDAQGQTDTTDNSNISLSLVSPNGATLSGNSTVLAVNGVATFTDLSITKAGTYALSAAQDLLTSANSSNFTIAPLAPAQLVVTTQPASAVPGKTIPSVSVAVEDQFNNIVTTDTSAITIKINTGTVGAILSGNSTVNTVNGVATFPKLSIDQVGNYTLAATDGNLTTAITDHFNVDFIPTRLVVTTQPLTTIAGQTINAITVKVEDALGHVIVTENGGVDVSLATGNGTLATGNDLLPFAGFVNGVATFNTLSINKAGSHSLKFTDVGNLTADSSLFTITPDLASAHLVVTQSPAAVLVGATLTPVIVKIEDQFSNVITTDHSKVTLTATAGPGNTLHGTATMTAAAGVATFSSLSLPLAGNYALQAADAALPTVSFNLTVNEATSILPGPVPPASTIFGQTLTLSTTLRSNASTTIPFTGNATLVDQNSDVLGTVTVTAAGLIKFTLNTLTPATYICTIHYAGDANHTEIISAPFTLHVKPSSTTTAVTTALSFPFGEDIVLSAAISTTSGNATPRTGNITFFDGSTPLAIVAVGSTFTIHDGTVGAHHFSAVYSGDTNFNGSTSPAHIVTITKDAVAAVLTISPIGSALPGQSFTLTDTLTDIAPGVGTPTGNVTFKDGIKILGTAPLVNGVATLPTSLLTAGSHSITAVYAGDTLSSAVTSHALTQIVTKAGTTTTVTSPNAFNPHGQSITFTATVAANAPAAITPTGSVIFKDGSKILATVKLTNGQALFTTAALALGDHEITATYTPDLNNLASISSPFDQTIVNPIA